MKYLVSIDGYYVKILNPRGDWCRSSQDSATRFESKIEAEQIARKINGEVEEEE